MVKLVIFDWNGTLIDDLDECLVSSNKVFEYENMPVLSKERYIQTSEFPIRKLYENNGVPKEKMDKNGALYSKLFFDTYQALEPNIPLRFGVLETLSWLKENDIQTIIVSNHLQVRIEKYLNEKDLNHYFERVIARGEADGSVLHEQFKEKVIAEYIKENDFSKKDVLMIGDSFEEIDVARSLGLFVASIAGGFVAKERLEVKEPDFLINEISEIKSIINRI